MTKEGISYERYITIDEFMKDAKPNTTAEDVRKEIEKSLDGKCCCLNEHGESINLEHSAS